MLIIIVCIFNFTIIKDPVFPSHNLIDRSSDPLAILLRLLL